MQTFQPPSLNLNFEQFVEKFLSLTINSPLFNAAFLRYFFLTKHAYLALKLSKSLTNMSQFLYTSLVELMNYIKVYQHYQHSDIYDQYKNFTQIFSVVRF